jgi:hypothetical protein
MTKLPRLAWLLIDGLSHELVQAYAQIRPRSLIASLVAHRRSRRLLPLTPNCQTPPSLFSIWSGLRSYEHGLTGYDVPTLVDGCPTGFAEGFSAWPRNVPMVWDRYAEFGQPIRTSAVPFVQAQRLSPWLKSATDVFRPPLLNPQVLSDGELLACAALQAELQVHAQGSSLQLTDADGKIAWQQRVTESSRFAATTWIPPGAVSDEAGDSHVALRLHLASVDGSPRVICLGHHPVRVHGSDAIRRSIFGHGRAYAISNPGKLHQIGQLGQRYADGGSGRAEALLMHLMRDVHDSFASDFSWALQCGDADLVVGYHPVIDLLSHQLLRFAVNDAQQFSGPMTGAFLTALDWLDDWFGELRQHVPAGMRFVVHSDHGMTPLHWDVHPNRWFLDQGWLYLDAEGSIDWRRSLVFLHPAENGLLLLHRQRLREAGLDAETVLDALCVAAAAAGLVGFAVLRATAALPGEEWHSDLYLQCPAGARSRVSTERPFVSKSPKGGDHTVFSDDSWLSGVLLDLSPIRWLPENGPALALTELMPGLLNAASESRAYCPS